MLDRASEFDQKYISLYYACMYVGILDTRKASDRSSRLISHN